MSNKNDWHERGELPPVGSMVEIFDCPAQLSGWNGQKVEVLKNIEMPDSYKGSVVLFDGCVHVTFIYTKNLRPIRTETDKLVASAEHAIENETGQAANSAHIAALIDAGWRPIKQQSEYEFVDYAVKRFLGTMFASQWTGLYRAGCRFVERGE